VAQRSWRRAGPIRVVLYVADSVLLADIADACENADIAVEASPPDPPPLAGEDWDVALADRPLETAMPVIALGSDDTGENWPANVRAVVPADLDAATLVAVITAVAAGYALAPYSNLTGKDNCKGTGKNTGKDTGAWADPADAAELASTLTPREREVLALLVEGASNKEIARALALSVHTVKFHIASLTEKLGARSRVEAVAIAIRAGLTMV
jgi:DNA-binding CsgD family transcriptional regulator